LNIAISPIMLAAGRRAFLRERWNLDDLYDFFEADLDDFLKKIYRAMSAAERMKIIPPESHRCEPQNATAARTRS
jgi:hypothetical protein